MRMRQPQPGPLLEADGTRAQRVARRLRTISMEVGGLLLGTVLLPVLMLGALLVDLTLWLRHRKPWVAVRLVPMLWWFLLGEVLALLAVTAIWVGTGGPFGRGSLRRRRWTYALRVRWARWHLGGARLLFGLKLEVEGLEEAGPGPALVLARHTSILDNLLPDTLLGAHHGLGIRFVVKRELEAMPAIDIGGRWIPTMFVRRGSGEGAAEARALRALAHDLGEGEVVLIYPEGTRFNPAKLARAKEIINERQPEIAPLAEGLSNVLPPRIAGPQALLDEAAGTDIVLLWHAGLDGYQHVRDVWSGRLVGQRIRVRFQRIPGSELPETEPERIEWLFARWHELDRWVGRTLAEIEGDRPGNVPNHARPA